MAALPSSWCLCCFPCLYCSSCVSPPVCPVCVFIGVVSIYRQQPGESTWQSTTYLASGFPPACCQIVASVYVDVLLLAHL